MLEIKSDKKVTNYADEQKARGSGLLASRRELNTKNFYDKMYNDFKVKNNKYLDDDFWSTAAIKGELDQLVYSLSKNETNKYLDELQTYGNQVDYDTYMLALNLPTLDNETKKPRLSGDGQYNYGDMTDREWGEMILKATTDRFDAELVEMNKDDKDWWEKAGAWVGSLAGHIVSGTMNALQNTYNLGEGIFNILTGEDFLEAFADDSDEALYQAMQHVKYATFELERNMLSRVNAVEAYEQGYLPPTVSRDASFAAGAKAIEQSAIGTGYNTWGRWWSSGLQSIGEMLPFMLIPTGSLSKTATKAIKTGGFYMSNVFSGGISDTVKTAALNGISYKDLNGGEVVFNAGLKAGAQYLMEILTGKILGFTGLDQMLGVGEAAQGASKWFINAAGATGAKAAGIALGRGALSMFKEGLEEVTQDLSDNLIDFIFGGTYRDRALDNLTWQNIGDAFVVGALTSGVIGTLSSASVIINRNNRAVGISEAGAAYKMGFFQQLNYNQAMQAMASWEATLKDIKATTQEKADAAFRLNGVAATLGNVIKTFGTERAQKALQLLNAYQNKQSTKEQKDAAKKELSDPKFAEQVLSEFIVGENVAKLKLADDLKNKIKKGLKDNAKKLKDNGTTKITDIVTEVSENVNIPEQSVKAVKSLLKQTGAEALVAIDGAGVVSSKDVIFAEESLIRNGKISEILQGLAYDKALKAIAPELNKKQSDLILSEYSRLTNRNDATIEDALIALLFDKSFYTYVLLRSAETQSINDNNEAIKLLATIDKIVKGKIAADVDKGTLTQAAYQKLVERIQENMRAGLLVFATNYANIDLDNISPEILPAELKTIIRNHINVQFTKAIDDVLEDKRKGRLNEKRIKEFNDTIDKFKGNNVKINEYIDEAKQKILSTEYNDRFDAEGVVRFLSHNDSTVQLTYLPSSSLNIIQNQKAIILVTEFFDTDWNSLVQGKVSLIDMPDEARDYITTAGYDLNNYNDRIAMLRDRMYTISNGSLTVSYNGEVLEVLDKNKLVKKEYLGKNGDNNLLKDIKNGTVKKLKDICKVTIDRRIGNLNLVLNNTLDANGQFNDNQPNRITLKGINLVNTIMHETTHATQYFTRPEQITTMSAGAHFAHLEKFNKSVQNKIETYIAKNFPLTYNLMMQSPSNNLPAVLYFNIDGEMQAMCKFTSLLFETGFTWNADKTILYSPDGKTSWNLTLKTNKRKDAETETSDITKTAEDRPLTRKEISELKNDKEIQTFIKDSYFKHEDGTPIIVYRLSSGKDNVAKDYKFFSTEPAFDVDQYTRSRNKLSGYVVNIPASDLIVIDAKNAKWDEVYLDTSDIENTNISEEILDEIDADVNDYPIQGVDSIASYLYNKESLIDIKGIYIKNVYEGATNSILTNDLVVFDELALLKVTKNDNDKFVKDFWSDQGPNATGDKYSAQYIKEYIENYGTNRELSKKEVDKYIIKDDTAIIEEVNSNVSYKGLKHKHDENEAFDNTKGDKKRIVPGAVWFTDNKNVAETYADLREGEVIERQLSVNNPLVIDAQGRTFDNAVPGIMTDTIVKDAKTAGYDSVIFENIVDVGSRILNASNLANSKKPSRDIVVFNNNQIKLKDVVKTEAEDISKISDSRKISNKIAQASNLKYFIKPGRPIQLDERIQDFVIRTTDDFDKLEPVIRKAIKAGTLSLQDIRYYVATATSINDYTFQMIAKYIYDNADVAKLTYKDMIKVLDNLDEIYIVSLFAKKSPVLNQKTTPDKMLKVYRDIGDKAKTDSKIKEKLSGYAALIDPDQLADPDQLHDTFFRHYNGTIKSVVSINNLGKTLTRNQEALKLMSNEGEGANLKSRKTTTWNWIDRMRKADINYGDVEQLTDTLSDVDRQDKINIIQEHIIQSIIQESTKLHRSQEEVLAEFTAQRDRLDTLSDEEINQLYMVAIGEGPVEATAKYLNIKTELEKRYVRKESKAYTGKYASRVTANATAKAVGRRIAQRLAGMKVRYNMLSPELQTMFDRKADKHYELNTTYQNMTAEELDAIIPQMQEAAKLLSERIRIVQAAKQSKIKAIERANRQAERMLDRPDTNKRTMREKIDVVHKVIIKNSTFTPISRESAPSIIKSVLATGWDKSRMSQVQELNNNIDQNVANADTFFASNPELLNMSTTEAEQAAKWFIGATITEDTSPQDRKKFEAIELYFLGYVLSEAREDGRFADLNTNVKTQIENRLRDKATIAGTALSVWNNVRQRLNPVETMLNQSVVISGVELTDVEQQELLDAAIKGDMETVAKMQERILSRIKKEQKGKKGILRRITGARSMSMLSSPLTWLRNLVSNFMLKRLNKWSANIGQNLFKGITKEGQQTFTGQITPEIQDFINKNFIDNKLFDVLVSNLAKYNPSDISKRFKNADGTIDKNAIISQMVIKSMYGKYYSENMFKSDLMNGTYQWLMKMMSDNNYVREAAIRYFGKIIAEKSYDLSKGVTDSIMTDFANAIGIAMSDYMHSNNFFNTLESIAAEHGETTLFIYKNLMPFMGTSWNWFKAAIRFSPIGLAQSIVKLTRLENEVRKQEARWSAGKSQVAPEYTEYLIRRDLGSGIIGTAAFMVGILLAALGWIDLEDDDYGIPKLVIGNVKVDVSSIFGTSSVLAGAALIVDMKDQGLSWDTVLSGLDKTLDVTLDGFFLTELMSLDMYSGGGSFATALDLVESTLLSFIPNGLAWIAGMTYTGTLRKKGFLGKAAAKIPFLAGFVNEKKIDPFTGKDGGIKDIINRTLPYFDIKMTSRAKATANSLGLNKLELKGQYKINNEEFNLSNKDVTIINKQYGEWNAKDLVEFLDDAMYYEVKDDTTNTYKRLTYSQMTDKQRKNTINNIMTKNAENAKILAWLNAGYSYYASSAKFNELKKLGISGKLFIGNKGFVKK